jgi:signal transduction histidine kinase
MDDTPRAEALGSCRQESLRPYHPTLRDPAPELLANMSHELRTPLTSILVYARLLADNPRKRLSAEEVGFAGGIHQAGSTLLHRLNDLLDPSRTPE